MMKYIFGSMFFLVLSACMKLEPRALVVGGKTMSDIDRLVAEKQKNGIILEDFESNTKGWFGCGEVEISNEGGALRADFVDARFACIGGKVSTNDLSDIPVIQLKIKATSSTFSEPLTFKLRMEDFDGNETNYDEETFTLDVNKEFVDMELDYTGKIVSVNADLDDQGIFKMKIFFNTSGSKPFTGSIFIDEITAKSQKSK